MTPSPSSDLPYLRQWIGRTEERDDIADTKSMAGLAALLDYDGDRWSKGEMPPLGHWLYFLPMVRQSQMDIDGHPKRGDFLPPVSLPRRMWGGSRIEFLAPIPIGAPMTRRSIIADVQWKTGSSGDIVFVTIRHEIVVAGLTAIREEQDLIYRGSTTQSQQPALDQSEPAPIGEINETVTADPVRLFRYAALTFNSHRIHYDRDYAHIDEGYEGLVVQGPYTATLLMDLLLRHSTARVARFQFRARHPLLATDPFDLCLAWAERGAELWTRNRRDRVTMTANVVFA